MGADTEIHSEALGQAPRIWLKIGMNDSMGKGVEIMMGRPTETADLS